VTLSLAWAQDPSAAKEAVRNLWICVPILIMTMSLVTRPEHARWLAFAYILGVVLSVLAGVADGGLHAAADISSATSDEGRLQGGTTDPNYLASAIPPAVVLAGALAIRRGRPITRIALLVAVAILAVGLAATQSRGGLLAAGVVFVGAVVVWKGRRATILGFFAVLAAMAAVWFASSPAAWQRVSSDSDGGSGRTDIWSVAWRMVEDRPFTGVGLGQFPVVSPQYLPQLGPISRGDLLIDEHIVVHNAYLQLWAEVGAIGLTLFLLLVLRSIASGHRAADRFEALGDVEMTAMARAALLAVLGSLTASFFLSNLDNRRTWLLFGLGPAPLALAVRESRARLRA
jgi:O-antigen ligase